MGEVESWRGIIYNEKRNIELKMGKLFIQTSNKLEDSRNSLKHLKVVNDTRNFRTLFNSFINSARSVTYALQKEGRKIDGFNEWYQKKQDEMQKDDLLLFIHEARKEDFHEGKHRLKFSTHIRHLNTGKVGKPPTPDADLVIGSEGPFWLVNNGTPSERLVPITSGGNFTTSISIDNPPSVHRGVKLKKRDPITICNLVLEYLSELVHEAKTIFQDI